MLYFALDEKNFSTNDKQVPSRLLMEAKYVLGKYTRTSQQRKVCGNVTTINLTQPN